MKLVRYGAAGAEQPGLLDSDGNIRDLSRVVADIDGTVLATKLDELKAMNPADLPLVSGSPRLGPPVAKISKLVCVGLNYSDHAAETGNPIPKEPVLFMKATSAISGPNDPVILPKGSQKSDWEVELGIVIGKKASYVSEADAMQHVAGYVIVNDVSEREFQIERSGGQWDKGKGCDTFAPIGPWLVTADEIPDPQNLAMWLEVDGKRYQNGSTRTMIFDVKAVVSYISQFMTLNPGDIIPTGTPPGVGLGLKPPVFLQPGNVMRLSIEGLGEQQQDVKAYPG